MRAIIYARENNPRHNTILQQMEICQNFADFYEYEIVGVALDIETLFLTQVDYDAVIVTKRDRISRNALEYQIAKMELLKRDVIIVPAVRPSV